MLGFLWHIYLSPYLPWNILTRYLQGKKFVKGYSQEKPILSLWLRNQEFTKIMPVMDRHFEYTFIFQELLKQKVKNKKIADIGGSGSVLPLLISLFPNKVTCFDVIPWPIKLQGVHIVKKDILQGGMPYHTFDLLTCLSTIEHVGLGRYGDEKEPDGDFIAMKKMRNMLKPKGLLFLTTEYGRPAIRFPMHRVYNAERFAKLIKGFRILKEEFYAPVHDSLIFEKCTKEQTRSIDPRKGYGIICCMLQKEE